MTDVFVVSLLHFNLQYVAGGLDGLYADQGWPDDNDAIEDAIVTESFAPVLDMLDRHPTWTMDLELQGYMVDVLAQRHPDVLDHLRTLARSGQVELVSVHWSDQLWTAYPWRDEEVSLALTRQSFEDAGLPLSDVAWTQEGQMGEGLLQRMPDAGYRIALLPRNLAGYEWPGGATSTIYTYGTGDQQVYVVPTNGQTSADGSYVVEWSYVDDGELLATGGKNPYLGPAFAYDPDAVAAFEADLEAREASGAKIVGVSDYVDAVASRGTTPLPPLLDGTWQPDDTGNLYRWMGGIGLWGQDERDNEVRTTVSHARNVVAAAESILGESQTDMPAAWKEALLAEVSDSTGWNPYPTEVRYALDHAAEAERIATEAVCSANPDGTYAGERPPVFTRAEPPDGAPLPTVGGRTTTTWFESTAGGGVYEAEVEIAVGDGHPSVSFPWDGVDVATTAALVDDAVQRVSADDVASDPVSEPLPVGLAHLTGDWWLVEDLTSVHLAGTFSRADGTLTFADETQPEDETGAWRFLLVEGTEADAIALATATNVDPQIVFECPGADAATVREGCGCDQGGAGGLGAGLVAVLVGLRRRRTAG